MEHNTDRAEQEVTELLKDDIQLLIDIIKNKTFNPDNKTILIEDKKANLVENISNSEEESENVENRRKKTKKREISAQKHYFNNLKQKFKDETEIESKIKEFWRLKFANPNYEEIEDPDRIFRWMDQNTLFKSQDDFVNAIDIFVNILGHDAKSPLIVFFRSKFTDQNKKNKLFELEFYQNHRITLARYKSIVNNPESIARLSPPFNDNNFQDIISDLFKILEIAEADRTLSDEQVEELRKKIAEFEA